MVRKVLLVGNGAREHAVAAALCKSKDVKLYAYMSSRNPGIEALAIKSGGAVRIADIHQPEPIAVWAKANKVDIGFPSPDAVLAAGVVDELHKHGIPCAAPVRSAARLEWDKSYLRHLMKRFRVPGCPEYGFFQSGEHIDSFIDSLGGQVAVKPVGLTGGKGVQVVGQQLRNGAEAKQYARQVIGHKIGGTAGVVIEEKLEGEEFTVQAFVQGRVVLPMPAVQDHKLAFEGDKGAMTGGMGSYSGPNGLLPFLNATDYEQAVSILEKVARAYELESSAAYKGILYGQFMLTKKGIYLVEINARFGDPEAVNVLSLLKTPLVDVFEHMATGRLRNYTVQWTNEATVVKYLVPDGYPIELEPPAKITIDAKKLKSSKASLYYASVDQRADGLYTSTSRAIAILGAGKTIAEAEKRAEAGCKAVSGPVWHRADIGSAALLKKRMDHVKAMRGR